MDAKILSPTIRPIIVPCSTAANIDGLFLCMSLGVFSVMNPTGGRGIYLISHATVDMRPC